MATPLVADLGRVARGVPRVALALPRSLLTRRRIMATFALVICAVAAYMLWFRHSSYVAAEEVDVTGVSFSEPAIRTALTDAGEGMSTVDPDVAALERSVRGFPTVASISVDADFPDRLAIEVEERAPVAIVGGGEGVPVAGDGTLLSGIEIENQKLPAIETGGLPASGALRGSALAQAEVLGATSDPLRPAIRGIGVDPDHGVEVALAGEVELRFGDSRNAEAKWAAAAAILADPHLVQVSFIDLRLPGRPAVGGTTSTPADPAASSAPASPTAGAPPAPATGVADGAVAP